MPQQFKQMRLHIEVPVKCCSETMYRYFGRRGGQLLGATQRIATLFESMDNTEEQRAAVDSMSDTFFKNLGDNVMMIDGNIDSGGSVKNWETKVSEGSVFRTEISLLQSSTFKFSD